MKFITSYRANKILYNFVISNKITGKVMLPANICPSVVDTLRYAGLTPLFVDISQINYMMDKKICVSLLNSISLIIYVHTYGLEESIDDFYLQIKTINPSIYIVDDRCLCVPNVNLQHSNADLVIYSMCPKKQVDMGIGAIGYVSENLRYHNVDVSSNKFLANIDYSFKLDEFIFCRDKVVEHKAKLNKIYTELLPKRIQMPSEYQNWRFNIFVENKEIILENIFREGLFASSHYSSLVENSPVAKDLQSKIINLFNDLYYTEKQAIKTCNIINSHIKV